MTISAEELSKTLAANAARNAERFKDGAISPGSPAPPAGPDKAGVAVPVESNVPLVDAALGVIERLSKPSGSTLEGKQSWLVTLLGVAMAGIGLWKNNDAMWGSGVGMIGLSQIASTTARVKTKDSLSTLISSLISTFHGKTP